MKLTIFDAGDGDCVLLKGNDSETVLFDGGRKGSFRANTAPALADIPRLDLVCVSHIDNDHIQGVLDLVDQRMEQIRADFHSDHPTGEGNANIKGPKHRPPEIGQFWYNSFPALTGGESSPVGTALAAQRQILASVYDDDGQPLPGHTAAAKGLKFSAADISRNANLATGFFTGIELEKKLASGVIAESVNEGFPNSLIQRTGREDEVPSANIGGLALQVLGPSKAELTKFKKDWKEWVEENPGRIASLEGEIGEWLLTSSTPRIVESARRSSLTPANLVSIIILAEQDGQTALFTGDAHQKDILDGLEAAGRLDQGPDDSDKAGHLNVVKIQHHGSPNNLDRDFAVRVTADHYLFCGNGSHRNPSAQVLDHIIDSRVAAQGSTKRATTEQTDDRFHLWFTGHPDRVNSASRKEHLGGLLEHVKSRIDEHPERFGATVLRGADSAELDPSKRIQVGSIREL
ncbi:MAG: MBL fold metallo-hydrolase [Acidimicrobiales bacterium]